jgi:tetratricopeptide (TPR) repeat protein
MYEKNLESYHAKYNRDVDTLNSYTSNLEKALLAAGQMSDAEYNRLVADGNNEYANEQYQKAEALCYRAAMARPDDENTLFLYGACLYGNKKYAAALQAFNMAPDHAQAKAYASMCENILEEQRQREKELAAERQRQYEEYERNRRAKNEAMWGAIADGLSQMAAAMPDKSSSSSGGGSTSGSSPSPSDCNCAVIKDMIARWEKLYQDNKKLYEKYREEQALGSGVVATHEDGSKTYGNVSGNSGPRATHLRLMQDADREKKKWESQARKCNCK